MKERLLLLGAGFAVTAPVWMPVLVFLTNGGFWP